MSLTKSLAVVDDEMDLVNLFKEALEGDGFDVSAFTDPIEALNHIIENPKKYSLIISDYKMPGLNGKELCTKLRADNPDLKVIIMSAYDQLECDISKFIFVSKPIPIARLLKIVKDTLTEANINGNYKRRS